VIGVGQHADAQLARYERIRDWFDQDDSDSDADFYARAALEFGIRRSVMEAEWARWLVQEIDRRTT